MATLLFGLILTVCFGLRVTDGQAPTTQPGTASITISITGFGTNTAGETYNLECSATVTGSTDQPTITWLDRMNNPVPSEMVTTTGSMSALTFNPLAASHAGIYKCRVTAEGVTETQTSTVIVNVITAQVTRSSSGPLTAGQTDFSLSCDATGTENLNTPTFIYHWRENGGVISGQQGSTLYLSPLTASNAGEYNCSVTVNSTSLSSTVTVSSSNTVIVSIQLPAPTSATVTNGSVSIGSDVTLTCTVELSPAVDVPVTVNTVWTGPAGFMTTNTAQPVMGSTTTYTSTVMVSSFGRDQSGNYTCTVIVSSISSFLINSMASSSAPLRVTVAPLPAPTNLVVTHLLATSISLSWEQPLGADAVNSYQINYNFTINECSGDNLSQGSTDVGNVTSFILTNSSQTPVEEDSTYSISVIAINEVINSTLSAVTTITSAAAPSGTPQNLTAIFVNATSITLLWSEVACQLRNGMLDGYQISYSGKNVTVLSGKTFTANRLIPRKQYTFSVNAFSTSLGPGPKVTITNETSVLQEVSFVLKNVIYGNNSIVSVEDIDENDGALLCYTNIVECCENWRQVGIKEWYFPNGTTVVYGSENIGSDFYRDRGPSVVRLNRRNNAMMPTGVFRCEIFDASGVIQSIYVGIYPFREGAPTIIRDSLSYSYDRNQGLKCTSIGGPATDVVWFKNGQVLGAENDQHKQIINETSSKYQNEILLGQQSPEDIIGTYTCLVRNSRGESARTNQLYGLQTTILEEAITLGSSLSINCTTDLAVTSLEWLDGDNNLLMNTSAAYLVLVIGDITEDHNKLEYTCRVISPFGKQTKSVTLLVAQPASSNSVGGIIGGVMLLLVCLVAIVISVVFIHNIILRKRRAGKNDLDQSTNIPTQLYEDPDKLTSSGQGNYELTECPAYESTTTKPQPHPTEVDQSSHYEL